jgi:hypothetical protein
MRRNVQCFLAGVIGMVALLSCRTSELAISCLFISALAIGLFAADIKEGFTWKTYIRTFIGIGGYLVGAIIVIIFIPQFIEPK